MRKSSSAQPKPPAVGSEAAFFDEDPDWHVRKFEPVEGTPKLKTVRPRGASRSSRSRYHFKDVGKPGNL